MPNELEGKNEDNIFFVIYYINLSNKIVYHDIFHLYFEEML